MSSDEQMRRILRDGYAENIKSPDPHELAKSIIARDRRNIRWLTILTTLLWILSPTGIIFRAYSLFQQYLGNVMPMPSGMDPPMRQLIDSMWRRVQISEITLLLAALSTMLLIYVSRRATLRNVNASLIMISDQLTQLRETHTPESK